MLRLAGFIIFLMFAISSFSQDRDMEIWNKNQVSVTAMPHFTLKASEKVHYSTSQNDIKLKYAELMLGHKIISWLEYGAGYRLTSSWQTENYWENENRAMLFCDINEPLHNFKIAISNRIEYRDFSQQKNHFRHRQSVKVELPSLTQWGMRFYVSEESFYKLTSDKTHLARVYAGITFFKNDHLDVSSYYALQKAKFSNKWYTSDVLGLNLNFAI